MSGEEMVAPDLATYVPAPGAADGALGRSWYAHEGEGRSPGGRRQHSVCCGTGAPRGDEPDHACVAMAFGLDEAEAVARRIADDHNAALGVDDRAPVAGIDGTLQEAIDALCAKQWDGDDSAQTADLVARLVRLTGALRDEREALRSALARVVRHEHGVTHAHGRAGLWDASNRAGLAGEPCARCHDFADAREALGLARWPDVAEVRRQRYDDDAAPVCAHRAGCGCGEAMYGVQPGAAFGGRGDR